MQTKTFNVYIQENQVVQDAYAMLTANIHLNNDEKQLKTIAVTGYSPCVGKTTLAINLAVTMAVSGWKVLLVDADLRKPVAAKRLNDESIYGLADYLASEAEIEDVLCKTNVKNLYYLSCGDNHPNPIGLLTSARFKSLMEWAKKEFDYCIFDTSALASVVDGVLVAAQADSALLVAEIGQTKLTTLKHAKDQLEKANANVIGTVLNRVKKNNYKKYFESYNYFFDKKKFINKKNKVLKG